MRKQLLILSFTLFINAFLVAQVGIGTSTPNPAAILDIQSNSAGLLIPRLALTGADDTSTIAAPVSGLIVYNTLNNGTLSEGFVFYDGTEWTNIGWKLKGNVAGTDSFLGTLNNMPLVFKAENKTVGVLRPNGAVGLGLNTSATAMSSFAFGNGAETNGSRSYAIGSGASSSAADAFAIGTNAVADRQNTVILSGVNQNVGIGTSDPSAKFHLNGSLRIEDGNQAAGKVLTSDANGNATWQTVASSGSGSGWALTGNTITAGNFLGTLNYQALVLRVNNSQIGSFHPNGGVSLGLGANSSVNQAFAIGENASAGNTSNYAFGKGANSSGSNAYALGEGAVSSQNKSYAIGQSSRASGTSSYAIGESSQATATNSYALGAAANAGATGSFAIGNGATSTSNNTLALGNQSRATNNNSTALGYQAVSNHQNAVAIGPATTAVDNSIILGNTINTSTDSYSATKVGIGTSNPTAKLQVDGSLRYVDGNQLNGRVLTSDDNGNATWQNVQVTTAYGDRYINYDLNVGTSNLVKIPFNMNTITPYSVNYSGGDATPLVNGIYRVTYSVSLTKTGSSGGNSTPASVVVYNGATAVSGSAVELAPTYLGMPSTVSKSVLVQYNGSGTISVYISKENGNRNLLLLENSNFNIELVRAL